MTKLLVSLIAGLIFGVGLIVSGMGNPAKVLNFLDLFGTWDPSLAFVMGGAVIVTFIGYRLVLKRTSPVLHTRFHLPTRKDVDGQLIAGASLFGLGWGLGGFCPGPAFVSLPLASQGILIFFPAMLVGMIVARMVSSYRAHVQSASPT